MYSCSCPDKKNRGLCKHIHKIRAKELRNLKSKVNLSLLPAPSIFGRTILTLGLNFTCLQMVPLIQGAPATPYPLPAATRHVSNNLPVRPSVAAAPVNLPAIPSPAMATTSSDDEEPSPEELKQFAQLREDYQKIGKVLEDVHLKKMPMALVKSFGKVLKHWNGIFQFGPKMKNEIAAKMKPSPSSLKPNSKLDKQFHFRKKKLKFTRKINHGSAASVSYK